MSSSQESQTSETSDEDSDLRNCRWLNDKSRSLTKLNSKYLTEIIALQDEIFKLQGMKDELVVPAFEAERSSEERESKIEKLEKRIEWMESEYVAVQLRKKEERNKAMKEEVKKAKRKVIKRDETIDELIANIESENANHARLINDLNKCRRMKSKGEPTQRPGRPSSTQLDNAEDITELRKYREEVLQMTEDNICKLHACRNAWLEVESKRRITSDKDSKPRRKKLQKD